MSDGATGPVVLANAPIYVGVDEPPWAAVIGSPSEAADGGRRLGPAEAEARMLTLLNEVRRAAGLRPLAGNAELRAIALAHTQDMIAARFFGHVSPTTGMVENRLQRAGVVASIIGENVAQADGADDAHRVLMDSPAHRANMLGAKFTHVGIGVGSRPGEAGNLLVTMVFARRPQPPSGPVTPALATTFVSSLRRAKGAAPIAVDPVLQKAAAAGAAALASAASTTPDQAIAATHTALVDESKRLHLGRGAVCIEVAQVLELDELEQDPIIQQQNPMKVGLAAATRQVGKVVKSSSSSSPKARSAAEHATRLGRGASAPARPAAWQPGRLSGRGYPSRMSASTASPYVPVPASQPGHARGIPALPLLTALNFFNYMDRQVVYGMSDKISETFHLSHEQFGYLAFANLLVFALASVISGPIADRIGARKVIVVGVVVWGAATIGSALSHSFWSLLAFRAIVGVGEGAYGPSANALLIAAAPPDKRGRALGIYNVGMAFGATTGLVLANAMTSPSIHMDWHNVFWIAAAPSPLLILGAMFVAAPTRIDRPTHLPARAYVLAPTYLIALAGGILSTFGASALVVWSRTLIVDERHLSIGVANVFMAGPVLLCAIGGVVAGGYLGDALTKRGGRGGHARAIGLSLLLAVPFGVASLLITNDAPFMVLTAITIFLLSVYNGPAAAVIDEMGPAKFAATLQAFAMFWIHVVGNAPAGSIVGWIADRSSVALGLQSAIAAFGIAGVLFMIVARRQSREVIT